MRYFDSMSEAVLEIQRDVYKGSRLAITRVQQWTDMDLMGRERIGYDYGIRGNFPETSGELVELGAKLGLASYQGEAGERLKNWLDEEVEARLNPRAYFAHKPNELNHPALQKTLEGSHPSYTYPEIMFGAMDAMYEAIKASPDSRRAYWPFYQEHHALRAAMPTRVPCSLGYHAMLRTIPGWDKPQLILTYLQRSADFDTFLLSDIWLARQFQLKLAEKLEVEAGLFMHYIISLHSFTAEGMEIY